MTEQTEPIIPTPPAALKPEKKKRIRTFSPQQIMDKEFKSFPLPEPWRTLIGEPEFNFSGIFYGKAKERKSSAALCFAETLSEFGKVLYISSEELISKSLQDRIRMNNINSSRMRIVGVRSVDDIELCVKRLHPKFIFIDSVQVCAMKLRDFMRLKTTVFKNRKSWHLISQTRDSGNMMLSQGWIHATDYYVKMEAGIASATGRFKTAGQVNIFKYREENPKDLFQPQPEPQFQLLHAPR
jgi:hypothetical protein